MVKVEICYQEICPGMKKKGKSFVPKKSSALTLQEMWREKPLQLQRLREISSVP